MQHHVTNSFARPSIVLLAAVLALLAACSSRGVGFLVGEYSTKEGGQAEVRITRDGGEFLVSVRKGGDQWSKPEKLVECYDKDYQELFGANWRDLDVCGLRASDGPFGIFRVKKGVINQGHTFKTGYFMFFLFGGGDVYRL
jgi:hypothetical protein